MKRISTSDIRKKKHNEKVTMLTAYDYSTAKILDEAGIDMLLVGDSLGMVMLGYEDTTKVTMADMIHHTKAVARGAKTAMVVADMPFLSCHLGPENTMKNAGALISEGGAHAVKIEGGTEIAGQVNAITNAGIPVVGHIGLTPQSVLTFGGFKIQGKTEERARKLIDDAKAIEEAGAFAIVVECVPEQLGKMISESVEIPVIGIGAGPDCDGQVLVCNDMLGTYSDFKPKFVKRYADLKPEITKAVKDYIKEVKNGSFPSSEHVF